MKTLTRSIGFLVSAVLLAGCSSMPTKIDKGPIPARTFSFLPHQGKPIPDYAEKRQEIHALVQNAITQRLAREQVSRVNQGGDVVVAYLIVAGNSAVTASINDYFGYEGDAAKLAEIAHEKYTGTKHPQQFEAGTLLIDIVDSKTGKVLRRGYATRPMLRDLTPDARAERVDEVVQEVLAGVQFRP